MSGKLFAIFISMILFIMISSKNLKLDSVCKLSLNSGKKCKEPKLSIRYYYNKHVKGCRAFYFEGCGGNANNFSSMDICKKKCI